MTGRRLQRAFAGVLGVLLVAAAVILPSAPASAMTQVGAVPSGVPGASVQAIVQNQSAGTGTWTITAPPDTSITLAQSVPAPGLGQFTCAPVNGGQQADCQTSTWGVGNQVAITMTIDPAADAPQTVQGSSTISGVESGQFSVSIVRPAPPAAPTVTAPAAGSESIATRPAVTGTKLAGDSATVTLDGEPFCAPPADTATTWACTPPADLAVGEHTVTATQTDRFGQVSPPTTSTFTVLAPATLTITQPARTEVIPTRPVTHTVVVADSGTGEARGVVVVVDLGGFPATTCTVDGTAVDCGTLPTGIGFGTVAPGVSHTIALTGAAAAGTAPGTTSTITTTATSSTEPDSPVSSSAVLVVVPLNQPVITSPAAGSSTRATTPVIRGLQAVEGAVVTVRQGPTVMCTAIADSAGSWSCTPSPRFAYGAAEITATQSFGGLTSGAVTRRFTVLAPVPVPPAPAPPVTQPGGTTPAPGSGSGSAGGGAGAPSVGSGGGPGSGGSGSTGAGTGSVAPSAPQPPAPQPPAPPTDGNGDGNDSGGTTGASAGGSLPMDLRFGAQRILPGTAADMRGTLGPNASGATVAITFTGRMSPGMVYRDVSVQVGDETVDCTVTTTTFSCLIPLDPGQRADVAIRVFADAVNAPDTAVQQIQVASNRAAQANAMTVTTAVAKGETEASQLADQITTFNVTEFPGAMVPLLAMLLFALAATVTGRRVTGTPDQTDTPPTTDEPSGSTR
jgi:hypothetical protein